MVVAILKTPRLRLKQLSQHHADPLYAICRQRGVGRFLITRPTRGDTTVQSIPPTAQMSVERGAARTDLADQP